MDTISDAHVRRWLALTEDERRGEWTRMPESWRGITLSLMLAEGRRLHAEAIATRKEAERVLALHRELRTLP